jgi:riboflavin biosynthesis pyrimidine reductase
VAIADEVEAVFGDPLREPPGVLHVTAVWQAARGELVTLRIGPHAPASATDLFCLGVARARCDALVTTGRILREEPEVRQQLPPELEAWRREQRGLETPPASVVLTGRADLDLAHPLLRTAAHAIVLTGHANAARLAQRAARAGGAPVEIVGRDTPGPRDTLRFLQQERDLGSVCIEAGPSSSRGLYEEPICVDELMLSVFQGDSVASAGQGGVFASLRQLERDFVERHRCDVDEPSGPWSFRRLVRRARA